MKTITIKDIVATARGTEILLPLLNGDMSITEWAQSIAKESVATKNGLEISAARSALNGAHFAMTNIAMALRSATELGKVPFTRAVQGPTASTPCSTPCAAGSPACAMRHTAS